jgi:hypothetical protein
MIESVSYVAFEVAILQPPDHDLIKAGTRYNAKLATLRYRPGETPVRYRYAQSTLNNDGQITSALIYSHHCWRFSTSKGAET